MDFSQALVALKSGQKVSRSGWNGKEMWIEIQNPDMKSKMTRPYIFISIPPGSTKQFGQNEPSEITSVQRIPWLVSQTDLMAEDWMLVITDPPANN